MSKPDKPKGTAPPALPPPPPTVSEISQVAQQVGTEEGRRLRKKTGRRATRLTSPELSLVPASIAQAGLKTVLG